MFIVESQAGVRSAPVLPLTTGLGPVRIAVTGRDRALSMWRDVVGLELLSEDGRLLRLGTGGRVLIELEVTATSPVVPHTIGLYHVALHVPTRRDLAEFALRALTQHVRIAPTDHLVSEAIYLWDHDGNGIEMTFETPWRGSLGDPERGAYAVTTDGRAHSGREPIDLHGLLAELDGAEVPAANLPAATRVGHIHVHVTDLEEAMRFYRDGLGFGGLFIIRQFGMGDVGLDYPPHTVAFNVWAGPGASLPPEGAAGLRWFTIALPDSQALDGVRGRLEALGVATEEGADGLEVRDPSGNLIKLRMA